MKKLFFTGDNHFFHKRICILEGRKFSSTQEMDEKLINNWNSIVSINDTVIVVGDFAFKHAKEIACQLNGEKIFVRGNHDKNSLSCIKSIVIDYCGIKATIFHDPKDVIYSNTKLNLSGHRHSKNFYCVTDDKVCINVGVDCWNYYPVEFKTLINYVKQLINEKKIPNIFK